MDIVDFALGLGAGFHLATAALVITRTPRPPAQPARAVLHATIGAVFVAALVS